MNRFRPVGWLAAGAALSLVFTSCGLTEPDELPTATPTVEPEIEEEEPEERAQEFELIDSWVNSDGYSYSIGITKVVIDVSKDLANARPGEAIVSYQVSAFGELENTTEARNAPSPRARIAISPVWNAASQVCEFLGDAWTSNVPALQGNFCSTLPNGMVVATPDNPLSEHAVAAVSAGGSGSLVVQEDRADTIVSLLSAPEGIVISRKDGDDRLTDCLVKSGGYWVSRATIDTQCTCGVGTDCLSPSTQ